MSQTLNSQFIEKFIHDTKNKELTLEQLNKILIKNYKEIYDVKPKAQTSYNIFVKTHMSLLKNENPDKNAKDLMKLVAEKWNLQKNTEQPSVNTEQQSVNTEQPPVNTEQQPVNTEQLPVNTEQPLVNIEQPLVNIEQQPVNTEQPPVNTEQLPVNTKQPLVNTEQQPVNTEQLVNDKPIKKPVKKSSKK